MDISSAILDPELGTGEPVMVKGKSGTTTLVDTGQLYNDFDWEIVSKSQRLSSSIKMTFHML